MKDNKLISMVEFVLENQKNRTEDWRHKEGYHSECNTAMLVNVYNYANFLKQPLTLGMFVPCDLGNVLEEPNCPSQYMGKQSYADRYKKAKERVLFEFETDNMDVIRWMSTCTSMEELLRVIDFDLTLTPNALKQIG